MKNLILVVIFVISMGVSYVIWSKSPEYIKQGGPLLVLGLTCLFMVFTFTIERLLVLRRAGGKGRVTSFMRHVKEAAQTGDMSQAIEACRRQGGSLGNIVGAGLDRYQLAKANNGVDDRQVMEDTRRAIEEAESLETPMLERNLSALSTIASIATMLGLLGTTIGMIRSFRAMSRAGAPDAAQLALGISEALVNTALGLTTAIIGIVLYNYFTTRVDNFREGIEETTYEVLQLLRRKSGA
jgi:biopolymer transport protein ExbB